MILISLRFVVSLKATRIFGPFIKFLKISTVALLSWFALAIIIEAVSSFFLITLLAPYEGCSFYSCLKIIAASSVGVVGFHRMQDRREAELSLATLSILLNVIVVGIVIAKINFSYKEIVRRGKLFYYKDLFEARYRYKPHPQFGFLAALQFPFGSALLPLLCVVRSLERKRKLFSQRKAESVLSSLQHQNDKP